MASQLFRALREADPNTPAALEVFDRIAAGSPGPDFFEHSIRVDTGVSPYRLSYYFDVHRHGAAAAHEAGHRFSRICVALGFALPAPIEEFVQSDERAGPEVLQIVLGIDAPARSSSAPLRAKYYLVFRGDPSVAVEDIFGRLDVSLPPDADPHKVFILGADVTSDGLDDLKLYFRLDPTSFVGGLTGDDLAGLRADVRSVVFQVCARRPDRRVAHVHASSAPRLTAWLADRGFGLALRRAESVNAALRGARLDPWIVSMAYRGRSLDLRGCTVYFHLAPA